MDYCAHDMLRSMKTPPAVRFLRYVSPEPTSGCHLWTGGTMGHGYGQFAESASSRDPKTYAHRFAWRVEYGEIPRGLVVCHKCDNTLCVNPRHLFLGTQADNMADMKRKGRHLYGEKNGASKLTASQVGKIRAMCAEHVPQARIAKTFGISQGLVSLIHNNLVWKNSPALALGGNGYPY